MGKVCFSDADGGGQFYELVELEEHVVALDCQFAGGKDYHCSNVSSLVSGSFVTGFVFFYLKILCIKGIKKAPVLPDPVIEVPKTSFPVRIDGMLISWISVGYSKSISFNAFKIGLQISANYCYHYLYLDPPTRTCFL